MPKIQIESIEYGKGIPMSKGCLQLKKATAQPYEGGVRIVWMEGKGDYSPRSVDLSNEDIKKLAGVVL